MRWTLPALLLLVPLAARGDVVLTPAGMVQLAAQDIATVPPPVRCSTRYLALWSEDPQQLDLLARLLSLHVNMLSKQPAIVPPVVVPGSQGWLLRVNLDDYGISPKVWENLAAFEPYFHQVIVADEEVGHYEDAYGRRTTDQRARWVVTGKRPKRTFALAPWLADTPQAAASTKALAEFCQSQVPIVGGSWLVYQTAIQLDRGNAGYADFLGFNSEAEFQQLIGFDQKILKRFPAEQAEAVANSGVTRQPRAITREGKIGGSYLRTLDIADRAIDKKNPLRVLDPRRNLDFDASEQMGHLPNGMLATNLVNNKGVRQDVAPQAVALDRFGTHNDLNVHIGTISCFRCHDKVGINSVRAWVRDVVNKPPLALNASDPKEAVRLRNLYVTNLEEQLDDDRRIFARAIVLAAGMGPQKALTEYAALWDRYTGPVDLATAARELGVSKEVFVAALDRQVKILGATDLVLSTYLREQMPVQRARELGGFLRALRDGPEPLPRDVWLESYPLAQLALRGAVPLEVKP